jgi:hypothetical protein
MNRNFFGQRRTTRIVYVLVLLSVVAGPARPVAASTVVNIGEIASGVAVSNSNLVVAGLANAKQGVIVTAGGATTSVDIQCTVSDVEIDAAGSFGWSVCSDSPYLGVMSLRTGDISSMDTKVTGAFDVEYSDTTKTLFVLGESGQLAIISARSLSDYEIRKSISIGDTPAGLAVSPNGRQAFVSTYSNRFMIVDTRTGKFRTVSVRLPESQQVSLGSLAMHPSGRFLFASGYVVKTGSSEFTPVFLTLNPTNGRTISSATLSVGSTSIDLAAGKNALYVGLGLPVDLPSGPTGLLQFSVNQRGQLSRPTAVTAGTVFTSEIDLSANGKHLVVATTNSELLRIAV